MLYFTDECASMGIWSQSIDMYVVCVWVFALRLCVCYLFSGKMPIMAPCRDEYFGNRLISFQKWFISVGWSVSHHDNSNKISKWIQCELPKFFFRPNEKCHCTNYKMENYAVVVTTILVLNSAKKRRFAKWRLKLQTNPSEKRRPY